ncbi:hypothetical protein [Nocardia cyriacigeorgica]|uniref:hypothetical protein n=1 Tax=Nocardia cyriacigeorgica TaxID=135487 RepID=UPI0024589030|nr:hypothetical protein [Nocardia cyriacigeorgica]
MKILDDPVNIYADTTGRRLHSRVNVLTDTALDLERAAWMYHTGDQDFAKALARADEHTRTPNTGAPRGASVTPEGGKPAKEVDPHPDKVAYPVNDIPDLIAPTSEDANIRELIDSTSGMLKDIDAGIREITGSFNVPDENGWSPLEQLIKPVSGNWSELERAGEVFMKAGAGAEAVAANLHRGSRDVDPYWNGRAAAAAYTDYANKLALHWNGRAR